VNAHEAALHAVANAGATFSICPICEDRTLHDQAVAVTEARLRLHMATHRTEDWLLLFNTTDDRARTAERALAGQLVICTNLKRQVEGLSDELAARPSLAERVEKYLEERQHTLSTAHLPLGEMLIAEAEYVLGEARELRDAVAAYVPAVIANAEDYAELGEKVRHEIADVALANAVLAGMLHAEVEACIEEKTIADRGRG
jgi:hypothetical protein